MHWFEVSSSRKQLVKRTSSHAQLAVSLLGFNRQVEHKLLVVVLHRLEVLVRRTLPQRRPLALPVLLRKVALSEVVLDIRLGDGFVSWEVLVVVVVMENEILLDQLIASVVHYNQPLLLVGN